MTVIWNKYFPFSFFFLHGPVESVRNKRTNLTGIVEQLVLKLLDPQDLLEHFVQLVLAEDELGGSAGSHPLLVLPGVFFPSVDGVELGYPRAQHGLFAQAVDLGQTAHALFDVLLKNLARVASRKTTALHHPGHTVTFQEDLESSWKNKMSLRYYVLLVL